MAKSVAQLLGMIHYEFLMHWRRRPLMIITGAVGFLTFATLFIFSRNLPTVGGVTDLQTNTYGVIFAIWAATSMALGFILPIMVADTIPLDRQYGVRELLNTLPLSSGVYLAGKALGAGIATLVGITGIVALAGIIWWVLIGAFDVVQFLELWLLGIAAMTLLNGAIGVLFAFSQMNRRNAIILNAAVVFFLAIPSFTPTSALFYLSPIRAPIVMYFLAGPTTSLYVAPIQVDSQQVLLAIVVGIVQLFVIGWLATLWMRPS